MTFKLEVPRIPSTVGRVTMIVSTTEETKIIVEDSSELVIHVLDEKGEGLSIQSGLLIPYITEEESLVLAQIVNNVRRIVEQEVFP